MTSSSTKSATGTAAGTTNARQTFDSAYYRRFYNNKDTRAVTKAEAAARNRFVLSFLHFCEVPVTRMLDLGAGLGDFKPSFEAEFPRAEYIGVDVSDYACERFGWINASIDEYEDDGTFEFVVCHDVIQYLDDRRAAAAIDNFCTLCSDVLYFGALTANDWEQTADRDRTDDEVFLRTARWYRTRLHRHFIEVGAGLFVSKQAPISLWELERH